NSQQIPVTRFSLSYCRLQAVGCRLRQAMHRLTGMSQNGLFICFLLHFSLAHALQHIPVDSLHGVKFA
ncbi:MAG TPA: hypothetical protein VF827_00620, partial [Syntrophales bacterium]